MLLPGGQRALQAASVVHWSRLRPSLNEDPAPCENGTCTNSNEREASSSFQLILEAAIDGRNSRKT